MVRRALALLGALLAAGCGEGAPDPGPPIDRDPSSVVVRGARFGSALEGHRITYPVTALEAGADVHVSLELAGRLGGGRIALVWSLADDEVEAIVDLADDAAVEREADTTWVSASLAREEPLPIGVHTLVVRFRDEEVARHPFEVGPPEGATPSVIRSAQTARGATVDFHPVEPTDRFHPEDPVHLTGCGDFGRRTWIRAEWRVAGTPDPDGTRTITLEEDLADTCFAFDFRPDGGWPTGAHEVVLLMNAREIGRYPFSVGP